MGVVRGALLLAGMGMGIGFMTGAELVSFFGQRAWGLPLLASYALWFGAAVFFLRLGKRYGNAQKAYAALFGRGIGAVYAVQTAVSLAACSAALAGLDAIFYKVKPLVSLAALGFSAVVCGRGTEGADAVSALLVPVCVVCVLAARGGGLPAAELFQPAAPWRGALYAAANIAFCARALTDAGGRMRRPVWSAALAAVLSLVCALRILGGVAASGTAFRRLPYLAARAQRWYSVVCAVAAFVSLPSSAWPLLRGVQTLKGAKKYAAEAAALLAAFALSLSGLRAFFRFFYPAVAAAGAAFLALCIFN